MSFNILMSDLETDINYSEENSSDEKEAQKVKEVQEAQQEPKENILINNIKIEKKKYSAIIRSINNYENDDNNDDEDDNNTKYEKYVEPIILDNINIFPFFKKEDIEKASSNSKLLQITDKGKYSISKPIDAEWITNIICKFCLDVIKKHPSTETITDGTAGIGGNVISFSKHFAHVNSIEINNIHSDVIKNNINALDITNVTHIHDNFLNFIEENKFTESIFFLDPPWGGKSYKNFKYFNLKLGKLMIYDIINLFHKKGYKYLCLKAPINLNVSPILANCLYSNYNIHKNVIGNMLLIIFY